MKTLRQFTEETLRELNTTNDFSEVFVEKRMELSRKYLKGRVLSTSHGADIFKNIIKCLNGEPWYEVGVYGENFKILIRENHESRG